MRQALRIGVTGGIGSGKTTVCGLFEELGVAVLDADVVAHQIVEPGQSALQAIEDTFGRQVIDKDGGLDRARLREWVFSDPQRRRQLEAITHPRIYAAMSQWAQVATGAYCILCIPLLIETGGNRIVDRILVVDVPLDVQKRRVMQRDNLAPAQIEAIIKTQATRAQRLAAADERVENTGDIDHLRRRVRVLHAQYLRLSTIT